MRTAEQILETQRASALRDIEGNVSTTYRVATFHAHRGHIEMAYVMGLITDDRYEELLSEWEEQWKEHLAA